MPSSGDRPVALGWRGVVLPVVGRLLIKGITATMRIHREGMDRLESMQAAGHKAVLAFFHGRQFLLLGCLGGRRLATMASLSRDGELQSRTMTGLGFGIARGSASRGGARGLIGLKRLMEEGYWPGFAVDGPRGPVGEVKPGAVYLAKKTRIPVIPLASSARPSHIFRKAWDRYQLPLPFSRGALILGEALTFDDDMSREAMARDCRTLQEVMNRLQEKADRMVGRGIED